MVSKGIEKIFGIHASRAVFKNPKRKIFSLTCTKDVYKTINKKYLEKIKKILVVDRKELDSLAGNKVHQGIFLECNSIQNFQINEIKENEKLILILDSLTDSQNVGSILRTAYLFGVKSIIFNKDNSFKMSPFLIKSASGAYEKVKMIETLNINRTIEILKKKGFWVIGLDSKSKEETESLPENIKKVIILGSEEKGIRKLVKKNCDYLIKIKTFVDDDDVIDSLNVSNACAIILDKLMNSDERTS